MEYLLRFIMVLHSDIWGNTHSLRLVVLKSVGVYQ